MFVLYVDFLKNIQIVYELLLTLICLLIIPSTSLNIWSRSSQQQTHCIIAKDYTEMQRNYIYYDTLDATNMWG